MSILFLQLILFNFYLITFDYLYICLSIDLPIFLSIYLSIYLPRDSSYRSLSLSIYLSINLFSYLNKFICLLQVKIKTLLKNVIL